MFLSVVALQLVKPRHYFVDADNVKTKRVAVPTRDLRQTAAAIST